MVMNSTFIEKLSESLNVNSFIDEYDAIMGEMVKGSILGTDEYFILISTKEDKFFNVRLLNNPPNINSGSIPFNGIINVKRLHTDEYKSHCEYYDCMAAKLKPIKFLRV